MLMLCHFRLCSSVFENCNSCIQFLLLLKQFRIKPIRLDDDANFYFCFTPLFLSFVQDNKIYILIRKIYVTFKSQAVKMLFIFKIS